MELDGVHGPSPGPEAHDDPILAGPRRDFKVVRQSLLRDDERVIARGRERLADAAEHTAAVVLDERRLAVHRHARPHPLPAEGGADGLVPKADAENWRPLAELADDAHRDA